MKFQWRALSQLVAMSKTGHRARTCTGMRINLKALGLTQRIPLAYTMTNSVAFRLFLCLATKKEVPSTVQLLSLFARHELRSARRFDVKKLVADK
jgi:hypothetical protein